MASYSIQALYQTKPACIGEGQFWSKNSAENMRPSLPLSWFTRSEKVVSGRIWFPPLLLIG
jgi:hypothetical protein